MAKEETINMTCILKPPFAPRPIPPRSASTTSAQSQSQSHTTQTSLQNGDINTTGALHASVHETPPLDALASLPTITGKEKKVFQAEDAIGEFLKTDLDLSRLNKIHRHLWMAGRPMRARPLHRYKMLGMEFLVTQQMDLHLLKYSTKLLLKPLPEYLLDHPFWTTNLCNLDAKDLWENAAGFLVSYVWLITTPLDLKLAHEESLVPSFVTWLWWKMFVRDFLGHVDINSLEHVNMRWQFGDLRLGRVNSTYRIRYFHTHFVRGYLYGYNRYVIFFQRNFSWILIVFVFFSLVLSAMQVGSGLDELKENYAFLRASYIFVVFSMVSVVIVLGIVVSIFVGIFLYNMGKAITHASMEQKAKRELAKAKRDKHV